MTTSDSHSKPQVKLQVVAINRRNSSLVATTHYTYEGEERKSKQTPGAEWEEVEFSVLQDEKPTIQIANITGSAFFVNNVVKLIINDSNLFGTYKVGDTIDLIPSENIQSTPNDIEITETPDKKPN